MDHSTSTLARPAAAGRAAPVPPATSPTGPAPAVDLRGLAKSFGAVRAVDGLDLRIEGEGTVVVLGPNGAGKSTTLSLLLGLMRPDAGEARVLGSSPREACAAGRVGAMLQETRPIPGLRIRELLDFLVRLYPTPMAVDEVLALAGLEDLATRKAAELSGGQLQRLMFAMAVAGRPDLLVLDEPTAAMDVESRHGFWAAMRDYARDGHTILFTTHYVEEAASADRVVVIDHGRVVADGSPRHLRESLGTRSVTIARPRDAAVLDGLPAVTGLEPDDDRVRLLTTDPDATVVGLAGRGLVRGLEVGGPSLEDAYLALTRHVTAGADPHHPTGHTTDAEGESR